MHNHNGISGLTRRPRRRPRAHTDIQPCAPSLSVVVDCRPIVLRHGGTPRFAAPRDSRLARTDMRTDQASVCRRPPPALDASTADAPRPGAASRRTAEPSANNSPSRVRPSSGGDFTAQRCTREPKDHQGGPVGQGWTRILTFSSLLLISSSKPSLTMSSRAIRPVMNWNGSTFPLAIISIVAGWSFA